MHVLISIDDQKHGNPSVKTLSHPVIVGDNAPKTPAVELGDFLMAAAQVWLETSGMSLAETQRYMTNLTGQSAIKH